MENVQTNKKHQKHNCTLVFRVSDQFPFFFFFKYKLVCETQALVSGLRSIIPGHSALS